MAVVERFHYIEYSDATKFIGDTTGRIELAGYPDELLLYSSFDSDVDATYAASDENAVTGDTVSIENFGVFGQHAWIKNTGYIRYNSNNFDTITPDGSIKFRVRTGFNNAGGYHEFVTTTNPSGDTIYGFQLTVDGTLWGDTDVTLSTGDTMVDISNAINAAISGSDASSAVQAAGNIRITADNNGDSVLISAPVSGNSLLTLLGGVGTAVIPNAPSQNVEIVSFYNGSGDTNRISIIHDTDSNILLRMYDDDGDTQVFQNFGVWSNLNTNWYAFELNWNESITQLFLNGVQMGVAATGFTRSTGTYLYLQSGDTNSYRFDELLVYNEYQHSGAYTVETADLSEYDDNDPYLDLHFGEGFSEGEVTDLNLTAHQDTAYVVKIGSTWYYYISGAWRISDGSYSQSVTPSIMETQFSDLTFIEEADLIVRAYFHSDGTELIWLDEVGIITETGSAETAIVTGTIDLSSTVDISSNYNLQITTDQGDTQVDLRVGVGDSTAVTLAELKAAINSGNVPGLASAGDDGTYLVLQTLTTGDSASITVTSGDTKDALSTVWGYIATDEGESAVGETVNYSELFRYIRSKLGEPLIPVELTDEQLEDCLEGAVYYYNRWRNFEEKILYTSLTGSAANGFDIPATVGGPENIIDIIMRPRYPYSWYVGRTDLVTNLYLQYLFQRYRTGFSDVISDYYITITAEEDINIVLGTQIKWEILNDKLWIWPEPDNMNIAIRYRGTMTAAEVVTNYRIKELALAEAKIVLGNIRSTFKSGIPGGAEMIQLNGEDLKQEGMAERERMVENLKKEAEPLFLDFF